MPDAVFVLQLRLSLACLLQIAEITNYDSVGRRRVQSNKDYAARLLDPRWAAFTTGQEHIELIPAHGCGPEVVGWLPVTDLAARLGLTVNGGYVARVDYLRWQRYCEAQAEEIQQGTRYTDTLYLVHPERVDSFRSASTPAIHCTPIDNLVACRTITAAGSQRMD